jgi:ribose operon repressor
MKRATNRNDVARLAKVAPSTVSNVLNGTKYVSDNVKERVLNAIKELQYEPSLLARSLKNGSTKQISVLVNSLENFEEIYRGMNQAAQNSEYTLSVVIANDKRADYYGECFARRSDGIINLSHFFCSDSDYLKLIDHSVAVVNVAPGKKSAEVSLNYAPAVEAFVRDLTEKKRTKLAVIADTSFAEFMPDTRMIALRYYMAQSGAPLDENRLRCFEENMAMLNVSEFGYRAMNDLMDRFPDTNAVFCVNDYIAMGVYKCLFERGKNVPRDISVCGCDNFPLGEFTYPALSTMSVNRTEFGRCCVESILSQLRGDREETDRKVLFASYIPRDSV